jgi:hypothetical protein
MPVRRPAHGVDHRAKEFRPCHDVLKEHWTACGIGHRHTPVRVFQVGAWLVLRPTVTDDIG